MAKNTRVIQVGKPTHMKLKNGSTACGLVGAQYAAYDARDVNCLSCMKTHRYAILQLRGQGEGQNLNQGETL